MIDCDRLSRCGAMGTIHRGCARHRSRPLPLKRPAGSRRLRCGERAMFQLLKRVFEEFSADNCPRMAAALAYYTIFSLAPLLVLAIALAGMVWNPEDVRGGVATQIERTLGPGGAEQVQGMLKSVQQPGRGTWATTLSLLGLVIGATAALGQLQAALNEAWSVEPNPRQGWGGWVQNFFVQRLVSWCSCS